MRQFSLIISLLVFGALAAPRVHAQESPSPSSTDPSDVFLSAYMVVKQAVELEDHGKYKLALEKYQYAAGLLRQLQEKSPDWQPEIVNYRLAKATEAIASLEKTVAAQGPGPTTPDADTGSATPSPAQPVVTGT